MKPIIVSFAAIAVLTVEACGVFKKGAPKTPLTPPTPPVAVVPRAAPSVVSADGVFPAGNAELAGVQAKHKDVTMQALKEGYTLYTGVCTNCHKAKSIYMRPEHMWPDILTSMAKEANITGAQKDALYKYVLAIKSTQPAR